jgi:spoIIIJ-associated protein
MAAHQESVFEGRTLDDAVRKGLDALGLSRAEVMITVMEEGSSGFLGLGSRPYRVRVMPRPGGPPREPAERGGRDRRRGGQGRGGRAEGRGRGPEGGRGRREAGRGDGRREGGRGGRGGGREGGHREAMAPRNERGERGAPRMEPREPDVVRGGLEPGSAQGSAAMEGMERRGRRRRGRRGRGRGEGDVRQRPDAGVRPRPEEMGEAMGSTGDVGFPPSFERVAPSDDEGGGHRDIAAGPERDDRDRERRPRREDRPRGESAPSSEPGLSGAELEARGSQITQDLLSAMGFAAKVSARADGENVDVIAEVAEDEDLLTGRKGEIRQALQHLLNLTINRGGGMRYHLQLEINEFWRRREAELQEQARAMADEAIASSREVITEYLNAQERRVIHVALREDERVKTYAIGDGLIKKLAVAPAGRPEPARADDD